MPKPKPTKPSMMRYTGSYHCVICDSRDNAAIGSRYHSYICKKCADDGVIQKMDDIFSYFVGHRVTPSERRKFNVLEKLAYEAYRAEVKNRAKKIEDARNRIKNTKIDLKYSEERRIITRAW